MVNVVCALVWHNGKFFICQRNRNKVRGMLWEFPGGKVKSGESLEDALKRECMEELSADISVGNLFLQFNHKYPDIEIKLSVYLCSFNSQPVLNEHNDFKWITPSEIDNFEFCPADKDVLEKIKNTFECYDVDKYVLPIWESQKVYYETGMFLGKTGRVKLLYKPDNIISIKDYGLNEFYLNGRDYTYSDGYIIRTENSAMPYLEVNDYYRRTPNVYEIKVLPDKVPYEFMEQRYIKFGEEDTFTKFQFAVTYNHSDKWRGFTPTSKKSRLKNFYEKLSRGKKVMMGFYGDSITTGCNASGTPQGGMVSPYADSYPIMVVKAMQKRYPNQIEYFNTAVGGWTTQNGLDAFKERVIDNDPDLLILAFGMNDMDDSLSAYGERTEKMVLALHEHNPKAEIVLVGTSLPNPETNWYLNQEKFVEELYLLEEKYSFVAVADVTKIYKHILDLGKKYKDISANNINHPNDFGARIYAQTILKTILGKKQRSK